jgi:ABC-type lipoprotein export system ATPase subunit
MSKPPLVLVKSVSKTYRRAQGTVDALRAVTLVVEEGNFVHLAGPSGSGKTTLLNLIAALDRPDSGDIVVMSTDVARLSVRDAAAYRREHVGFVFQSYNLIPQLTALENVLLPMISKSRVDRQRAAELLDRVDLADRQDHRPPQLSGGEQQRVAIARALANAPPLILADEPIGNLDDETGRKVMDLLVRSCRERGTTLVLVSHNIGATQTADTTFVLKSGILTRMAEV